VKIDTTAYVLDMVYNHPHLRYLCSGVESAGRHDLSKADFT
jgi:hypothetical protein